jgi:predicted restriction endonuclease
MRNRNHSGRCALCGRHAELTFHHLIPRKAHRRPFFRKHFSREDLAAGVDLCRLCHKGVHRLHDEMTLARRLNSLDALRADPAIARHAAWVRKQKRGLTGTHTPDG